MLVYTLLLLLCYSPNASNLFTYFIGTHSHSVVLTDLELSGLLCGVCALLAGLLCRVCVHTPVCAFVWGVCDLAGFLYVGVGMYALPGFSVEYVYVHFWLGFSVGGLYTPGRASLGGWGALLAGFLCAAQKES